MNSEGKETCMTLTGKNIKWQIGKATGKKHHEKQH